jgi:hypothetical protein
MLGAPLQCSAFITKHPESLAPCNSLSASYLFQPDKFYPVEYDRNGDKSKLIFSVLFEDVESLFFQSFCFIMIIVVLKASSVEESPTPLSCGSCGQPLVRMDSGI